MPQGPELSDSKSAEEEHRVRVLVPRQDLTGADRAWAGRYEIGDVLRYSRASKEASIGKGEYARVAGVHSASNGLTVEKGDGTEESTTRYRLKEKRLAKASSRTAIEVA